MHNVLTPSGESAWEPAFKNKVAKGWQHPDKYMYKVQHAWVEQIDTWLRAIQSPVINTKSRRLRGCSSGAVEGP